MQQHQYDFIQMENRLKGPVRKLSDLVGRRLYKVEQIRDDELRFYATDDNYIILHHLQDCCESVHIEDVCGDLQDLEGCLITQAEAVDGETPAHFDPSREESYTWTFYCFQSTKGSVTVRWFGSSNGYYSEGVDVTAIIGGQKNRVWQ